MMRIHILIASLAFTAFSGCVEQAQQPVWGEENLMVGGSGYSVTRTRSFGSQSNALVRPARIAPAVPAPQLATKARTTPPQFKTRPTIVATAQTTSAATPATVQIQLPKPGARPPSREVIVATQVSKDRRTISQDYKMVAYGTAPKEKMTDWIKMPPKGGAVEVVFADCVNEKAQKNDFTFVLGRGWQKGYMRLTRTGFTEAQFDAITNCVRQEVAKKTSV